MVCFLRGRSPGDGTQRSLLLTNSRTAGNDLLAFRFVYDSVCLHSGLLNWLQNRLEMVLLLSTSHNSPSHQPRAIFYLGDDISIRVCQPLTAAPWVVVFHESIVNQDNINEISLAGGGQGISSDDCSARTHTVGGAWTCSVSLYCLFFAPFPPLSFLQRDTEDRDLTKARKRDAQIETEIGQRGHSCQPSLTSFSIPSKAQVAHKGSTSKPKNPEAGLFQRSWPNGSHPLTLAAGPCFYTD